MSRVVWLLFFLACLPLPAQAYVDPGTGMMLLQGLIALVGALIVFFRNPVEAVKRLIKRMRKN